MKTKISLVAKVEQVKNPQEALAEVLHRFGGLRNGLEVLKAKFIEDFQKPFGAAYAISWKANNLIAEEFKVAKAEELLERWNCKTEAERTPELMLEWLKELSARITDQLVNNSFRPCSTSPHHNAEEITNSEAASNFLRYDLAQAIRTLERNLEVKAVA